MKRYFLLIGMCLILLLTMACELDNGSAMLRVFNGTITVPDSSYWTYVTLGIFSDGDTGYADYPDLDYDDNNLGVDQYRLIYDEFNDGSDVSISQVPGGTGTITGTGDTTRSYSYELPQTLPEANSDTGDYEYYRVVCFYDNDLDSNIDLKDQSAFLGDPDIVAQGEFNRFPTKYTYNSVDEVWTTITIFGFIESSDISGNPTGNYKYTGYDENAFNEQEELSGANKEDIDFNITANTGW